MEDRNIKIERNESTMIKERVFYYISFKLESPLSIGNGDSSLTDHDCIRNNKGQIFIPATSLSGVFSHYLNDEQRNLFAPVEKGERKLSPYFISDAILKDKEVSTSIRDGVKLGENKVAVRGAKFNFEVIETGAEFDFRIELTIRDNDNEQEMKKIVDIILNGLKSGEILLGYKAKRGYGKMSVKSIKFRGFRKENLEELLNFDKFNIEDYCEYDLIETNNNSIFDYIEVELEQLGGLSIRRYGTTPGEADFEHIKSKGKPIIPGTSWAGTIRRYVDKYVKYIEEDLNTQIKIDTKMWFGTDKDNMGVARASNIIIEESEIIDAKEIEQTRNKIDRFSGGAVSRALFTERAVYKGKTKLGIKVKKQIKLGNDINQSNEKVLGLLALCIKDIDNGLISLGGQTSIGRGLFKVNSYKLNNEEWDLNECIAKITGGGNSERK